MVVEGDTSAPKEMNLRYPGTCIVCGEGIPKGTRAIYEPGTKVVRHIACPALERGVAGGSAMREYERRKARDEARIQEQKESVRAVFGDGFIGKVATFLAVDDSPRRSTGVWAQGAVGEERVAGFLDALAEVGVVALHDRRIPGTRANIDHIAVTPWGVWVIDAKYYIGKRPDFYIEGGFLGIGGTPRLTVGGRKSDKLVEGVLKQVDLVRSVVGDAAEVKGVLCFVDADWPLLGGDFTIRGVRVVWPRRLAKEILRTEAPLIDTEKIGRLLAAKFPPA